MLFTTGRILEASIATEGHPSLFEKRRKEVAAIGNPIRRSVASKLLDFAQVHPPRARQTLDAIARLRGYQYLGSGVEFSAYLKSDSQEVVKIFRASSGMPINELDQVACEVQSDYALLAEYLGSTALQQETIIAEHILGGGHQTVQVVQPIIDVNVNSSPFISNEPTVDIGRLEKIVQEKSGSDEALREFCERSHLMYNSATALPDTNGQANIAVNNDGSVSLIDNRPIRYVDPDIQKLVLSQLRSLEDGLVEIAA